MGTIRFNFWSGPNLSSGDGEHSAVAGQLTFATSTLPGALHSHQAAGYSASHSHLADCNSAGGRINNTVAPGRCLEMDM
jgi:hypothetical protein